jgi:hypothetical protein
VEAEILFSRTLLPDMFKTNESLKQSHYEKYPALSTICQLLTTVETNEDKWLIYELGPQTLSQQLCIIKSDEKG